LDEAFKILRPNEVAILKRASADVDSFWTGQSRALSYQHHMTGEGQSVPEATALYQYFIVNQLALTAWEEVGGCGFGDHESALYSLGRGMHAVVDSHSPYHKDLQVWNGIVPGGVAWILGPASAVFVGIGIWTNDLTHHFAENKIQNTDPSVIAAIAAAGDYYRAFESVVSLARLMRGSSVHGYQSLANMELGNPMTSDGF